MNMDSTQTDCIHDLNMDHQGILGPFKTVNRTIAYEMIKRGL